MQRSFRFLLIINPIFLILILILILIPLIVPTITKADPDLDNTQKRSVSKKKSRPTSTRRKKIVSEYAVFRINEDVFFLSDLKKYRKVLVKIKCLKFPSFVLEGIGIDVLPEWPTVPEAVRPNHKDFFQKLIMLIKLEKFIVNQEAVTSLEFIEKLKLPIQKCLEGTKKTWSSQLMNFFKMEGFLRGRFKKDTLVQFLLSLNKKVDHDIFF